MEFSPALSVTSEMTDEELDQYFATYVPLSNLPTPPPAKEHATASAPSKTALPASTLDQAAPSPELEGQSGPFSFLSMSLFRLLRVVGHVGSNKGYTDRADQWSPLHKGLRQTSFSGFILSNLLSRFTLLHLFVLCSCRSRSFLWSLRSEDVAFLATGQ